MWADEISWADCARQNLYIRIRDIFGRQIELGRPGYYRKVRFISLERPLAVTSPPRLTSFLNLMVKTMQ